MLIRWAGHAAFVIQAAGHTIVTDPFGEGYGYNAIPDVADLVTVSHGHNDHAAVNQVQGKPTVVQGLGKWEFPGVTIEGFPSFHDKTAGSERGLNTIFKISAEGVNLLHAGDLGEIPSASLLEKLGSIDILLIPVGDVYTINGAEAAEVVRQLRPKIAIPMHYKTPDLIMSKELATAEPFTQTFDQVIYKQILNVSQQDLTGISDPQIYVLAYK